jgi:putative transposase
LGTGRGGRTDLENRERSEVLIAEAVAGGSRLGPACEALGLCARTMQRWKRASLPGDQRRGPKTAPANKLTLKERTELISVVNSAEHRDSSPSKIVPALADEGVYLASESTIYRILKEEELLTHRSASRPPTHHRPDPFEAIAPNRVWSWDITYLKTVVTGIYFYLYLIMDIYSRKIVGWEVHEREASELSSLLMQEALTQEGIDGKELVVHSDNGGPMKGATMLVTLQNLGVITSFSRPSVSDDNPFSESLFKTLKYCPCYPITPFPNLEAARAWVMTFVRWYNTQHLHSGIKFVTPEQRHRGDDTRILANRTHVYEEAKQKNPARWSGKTRDWAVIKSVRLNPLRENQKTGIHCVA